MTGTLERRKTCGGVVKAAVFAALLGSACAPVVPNAPAAGPAPAASGRHQYKRVDQGNLTFEQAREAAAAMTLGGLRGHLAVFESPGYETELAYVHSTVYAPGAPDQRVYWVGAQRPRSSAPGTAGWTWVDGSPVAPEVASTWIIDFHEGPVAEGAGFFWVGPPPRLGDYAATNPSKLVGGYIVEFE